MTGDAPAPLVTDEADYDDPGSSDWPICYECGGEGFVADCFDGCCLDAEWGCDDCTERCSECQGKGGWRQIFAGDRVMSDMGDEELGRECMPLACPAAHLWCGALIQEPTRAGLVRLIKVGRELALYEAGVGPAPKGVILCGPRLRGRRWLK
jgi:hypothetical protein